MPVPRLLQLLGLILVGAVLVASLTVVDDMTFEFGGLLAGSVVFLAGKLLERRSG